MKDLIQTQRDGDQKPLLDALEFWNKVRPRWATAFKSVIHGASRSSLAEVAHASMVAAREKGLSLVDSVYADISDSLRLSAKWENRQDGESSQGSGPSGLDLLERDEERQIQRAKAFIRESAEVSSKSGFSSLSAPPTAKRCRTGDESDVCTLNVLDPARSHRPDKQIRVNESYATQVMVDFDTHADSSSDSEESQEEPSSSAKARPTLKRKRPHSLTSKTCQAAIK